MSSVCVCRWNDSGGTIDGIVLCYYMVLGVFGLSRNFFGWREKEQKRWIILDKREVREECCREYPLKREKARAFLVETFYARDTISGVWCVAQWRLRTDPAHFGMHKDFLLRRWKQFRPLNRWVPGAKPCLCLGLCLQKQYQVEAHEKKDSPGHRCGWSCPKVFSSKVLAWNLVGSEVPWKCTEGSHEPDFVLNCVQCCNWPPWIFFVYLSKALAILAPFQWPDNLQVINLENKTLELTLIFRVNFWI